MGKRNLKSSMVVCKGDHWFFPFLCAYSVFPCAMCHWSFFHQEVSLVISFALAIGMLNKEYESRGFDSVCTLVFGLTYCCFETGNSRFKKPQLPYLGKRCHMKPRYATTDLSVHQMPDKRMRPSRPSGASCFDPNQTNCLANPQNHNK